MNCPGNPYDSAAPWNEKPQRLKRCPICEGDGWNWAPDPEDASKEECDKCEGTGEVPDED